MMRQMKIPSDDKRVSENEPENRDLNPADLGPCVHISINAMDLGSHFFD